MLHQVFEQFEFLVGQVDRDAAQVRGVAVGVHDQLARADQSVLLRVGLLRRAICGHSVGVAALRDKAQTSFHLGGRGARHDHIAHTPLRIDHGEASLGQDEQDRRGQAGSVDHAAQRLRVRQVVAAVEQQDRLFGHLHQARRVHRQHAHTVRQQRERRQHGRRVGGSGHQGQIHHVIPLWFWFGVSPAAALGSVCVTPLRP